MQQRKVGGLCKVCKQAEAKYRCPTCRTTYCSVGCYRTHKETLCQPPFWQQQQSQSQSQQQTAVDADAKETEETYRVSERQLRALGANEALRRALGDPDLCELLAGIDDARDRERALDDAVATREDFAAFQNAMLQTIGVRDIDGTCVLR